MLYIIFFGAVKINNNHFVCEMLQIATIVNSNNMVPFDVFSAKGLNSLQIMQ